LPPFAYKYRPIVTVALPENCCPNRAHPLSARTCRSKQALRITAAKIEEGRLVLPRSKSGKILGDWLGDWAIWSVVEQSSKQIGIEHFSAHDLRRTCAKLCRKSGGDLEQIKFLLGHSSIQTTERYLGSEQDIIVAVNDNLGL
jgi:integrase